MPDIKRLGVRLVVDDADIAEQNWNKNTLAAEGYAEVLRLLVPLQAEQAIGVINQSQAATQYANSIEGEAAMWERLLTQRNTLEQTSVIKSAQNAVEYEGFWKEALEGTRESYEQFWKTAGELDQQGVVAAAQASKEYVAFWEDAIATKLGFYKDGSKAVTEAEQQEVVKAAQAAAAYVKFWEDAVIKKNGLFTSGGTTGSLFSDPSRADEMARVQAENAAIAARLLAEAQEIVNKATVDGTAVTANYVEQLMAQGMSAKEAAKWLKDLGVADVQLAEAEMTDAEAAKIVAATHEKVTKVYADEEKQIKLLSVGTHEASAGHEKLTGSAVASSRAFFALTLASFGLMSISQELKKSFGDDLPPAFEKTSAAVQQIASFGSSGAFIGGVGGAIVGGIVGGVLALTTASTTLEPALQQVNQQLDNMSNRDEVVDTISRITGASTEMVKVWDEAARKDPNFATYLEEVVKKAEPLPPLLATIKSASKNLFGSDDENPVGKFFGDIGETVNKISLLTAEVTVGIATFAQELKDGVPISEAWGDAQQKSADFMFGVINASQGAKMSSEELADTTARANAVLEKQEDILKKLASAQDTYANAVQNAAHSQDVLAQRTANQYAQARQQFDNSVQDAAEARQNSIADSEQTLTDRIADLWQDLQNKVIDVNQQLADKVFDINTQLQNKLADIQTQLGNKISDIQQDLQNKLNDLAHQRDNDVSSANKKIEDAARDLARKLYEIERDRIQATNALDFNTGEQLRLAKTEHDRQDILRRHQFEQGQIDQQANNARSDAMADFRDKVEQANKEKQLAKDTYDYQVMLARQLADQKIAQANRDAAQQVLVAQRQAQQQLLVAQREHDQALLIAERRYEQEKEAAVRTYNEQVLAARRAEEQKLADAQRALAQRNAAIAESYRMEREQILYTLELALWAFNKVIEAINMANKGMLGFMQTYQNFIDDPLGLKGLNSSLIPTQGLPSGGGMLGLMNGGGSLPIPKESNLIGKGVGQTNVVNVPGSTSSTSNKSMTFHIYDATNPQKVAGIIRDYISNEAWR